MTTSCPLEPTRLAFCILATEPTAAFPSVADAEAGPGDADAPRGVSKRGRLNKGLARGVVTDAAGVEVCSAPATAIASVDGTGTDALAVADVAALGGRSDAGGLSKAAVMPSALVTTSFTVPSTLASPRTSVVASARAATTIASKERASDL